MSYYLDLFNLKAGEQCITAYIRSGKWKFVACKSYTEAHNFQWFAIEQLSPKLNAELKSWDGDNHERYSHLLSKLQASPCVEYTQIGLIPSGPGVYVLFHEELPESLDFSKTPT